MRVGFLDCVFDSEARELTRAGRRLEVTPRAFELLGLLLAARPRALSKSELADRLWPDTLVGRTSLARLVTELRKLLGDDPEGQRILRTVRGFGYAFAGEARADAGPAAGADAGACWLLWGTEKVALREGENLIGRAADCRLAIPSSRVSRRHARIVVAAGSATLEDLGSTNGTRVRDSAVSSPVRLADGDAIAIGPVILVFRSLDNADASARTTEEERPPR